HAGLDHRRARRSRRRGAPGARRRAGTPRPGGRGDVTASPSRPRAMCRRVGLPAGRLPGDGARRSDIIRSVEKIQNDRRSGLRRVTIVGVAEGVYYTPQIVALELGFFEDEGLRVVYNGRSDPHGLARAVSEGRADVALGGLWRPLLYAQLGVPFVAF